MDSAGAGFVEIRNGSARVRARAIAPESLFATELLLAQIQEAAKLASGRMLDIGCGTKPYKPLFAPHVKRHIGCDMLSSLHGRGEIDAGASATALPFASESFDFVLCTEVLEHVSDPFAAYREIGRVLRPGGRALVSTPFMYRVHESPHDFFRYTPFAHRRLAEHAGLHVSEIRPRGGYISVLADYLIKGVGMSFGAFGRLCWKLTGKGRGFGRSMTARMPMAVLQRMLLLVLRRESLNSATYTLGYLVLLEKPNLPRT